MTKAKLRLLAIVAVLSLALSGCSYARQVTLKPGEFDIPKCESVSEIPVEEITVTNCDLVDTIVVFPDGETQAGPEIGAGTGSEKERADGSLTQYSLYNFGTHGLAASYRMGNDDVEWWGSKRAVELSMYLDG